MGSSLPRFLSLLLLLAAGPAMAAEEDAPADLVALELELSVVSDYRYRGLSLSGKEPALQAGLSAALANGAYIHGWGSTIESYGAGRDGQGARAELDVVLGWAGAIGGLDVDVSAQAYVYPGGTDVNYVELPVAVSRAVGDWRWTVGGAYAPSQETLGHEDNVYGWAGLAWGREDAPVTVRASAGYEDGAYAPGGKWDWSAGVSRRFGPIEAGFSYVDSDRAGGGLLVSLAAAF